MNSNISSFSHSALQIIKAFVQMRKFIADYTVLFQRMDKVERKHLEADEKFLQIFDALQQPLLPEHL